MYDDVIEVEDAKEFMRKKNENKFLALYKMSEPARVNSYQSNGFSLC